MEEYKKKLEYDQMLKDGVISESEYQKLKDLLYASKMAELGIQDEVELEETLKKDAFKEAVLMLENNTAPSYREAIALLESLGGWGNSTALISQCRTKLVELEKIEEEERIAAERAEQEENYRKQEEKTKKRKHFIKIACIIVGVIVLVLGGIKIHQSRVLAAKYSEANAKFDQGNYLDASAKYDELGDYKDAKDKSVISIAKQMQKEIDDKQYDQASQYIDTLKPHLGNTNETGTEVTNAFDSYYEVAEALVASKDYESARDMFSRISYKDSEQYASYCNAAIAVSGIGEKSNLTEIYQMITALDNFADADKLIDDNKYLVVVKKLDGEEWEYHPNDTHTAVISVVNGEWKDSDYWDQNKDSIFVLYEGKVRVMWKDLYDDDDYRWYDDIEIKDDKLILNGSAEYEKV